MNIAVISNFDKDISPTSGGGSETFVYDLVTGLADKGHTVDVFGVGKNAFNHPHITFQPIVDQAVKAFINNNKLLSDMQPERPDLETQVRFSSLAAALKKMLGNTDYDIIHDNSTSALFNSISSVLTTPVISTAHTNYNSPSILVPYFLAQIPHPNQHFISISHFQKTVLENNSINIEPLTTVYNGTDITKYQPSFTTDIQSAGLWIGRISRKHDKGIKEALLLANMLQIKLNVITVVDDEDYFASEIKPLITPNISFISHPITMEEKISLYQHASFLLYPLQWDEPFGLIFIEAMACGTPVIAYARGAVPEIIKDNVTGFVVNSSEETKRGNFEIQQTGQEGLKEAIERLTHLPDTDYQTMRKAARQHVEENFTKERMVDNYIAVYEKILAR